MNTEVLSPDSSTVAFCHESFPSLNLIVLFADADTVRRADELTRRLAGRLGPDRPLRCSRWPFDGLDDASLHAADQADLLMVAAHAARKLPGVVSDWLDQALAGGAHGRALVALLEGPPPGEETTSAAAAQLRAIALRAGIVFIMHWFDRPGMVGDFSGESLAVRLSGRQTTVGDILPYPQSTPRWGINE